MTCIAAVTDGQTVTMGADSAGVSGYDVTRRADPKVFINGHFLIGFAESFRVGQVLRYCFAPPKIPWIADSSRSELMRYMVKDFMGEVRDCLAREGIGSKINQIESVSALFLVGVRGRIFRVDHDYQVGESLEDFESIGIGHPYARGSLHSTQTLSLEPRVRVEMALDAAAHLNGGVCPPFTILTNYHI